VLSTWSLKLCSLMALLQLIFALAIWLSRQTDTWLALWLAGCSSFSFLLWYYIYIYIYIFFFFVRCILGKAEAVAQFLDLYFFFLLCMVANIKNDFCLFYRISCNLLHSCWQAHVVKELHAWFHW